VRERPPIYLITPKAIRSCLLFIALFTTVIGNEFQIACTAVQTSNNDVTEFRWVWGWPNVASDDHDVDSSVHRIAQQNLTCKLKATIKTRRRRCRRRWCLQHRLFSAEREFRSMSCDIFQECMIALNKTSHPQIDWWTVKLLISLVDSVKHHWSSIYAFKPSCRSVFKLSQRFRWCLLPI
jgi:hypothetical protein